MKCSSTDRISCTHSEGYFAAKTGLEYKRIKKTRLPRTPKHSYSFPGTVNLGNLPFPPFSPRHNQGTSHQANRFPTLSLPKQKDPSASVPCTPNSTRTRVALLTNHPFPISLHSTPNSVRHVVDLRMTYRHTTLSKLALHTSFSFNRCLFAERRKRRSRMKSCVEGQQDCI